MDENTGSIIFKIKDFEIMRFDPNGDIFVKGSLVENDREIIEGLRQFLIEARYTEPKDE